LTADTNIIAVKQARAAAIAGMAAILEKGEREQRNLTAPESRDFDRLEAETKRLTEHANRMERLRGSAVTRSDLHAGNGRGNDHELRVWMANELRDLTTGSFGTGIVPPEFTGAIWDRLRARSTFLDTGVTVIDTNKHSVQVPALTADATAAWTAENGTITASDPTGGTVTLTPSKIAALTKFSRESAEDANPGVAEVVLKNLAQTIALGVDLGGYFGTGASNQPLGVANTAGITVDSATMGANGAVLSNLDPLLSSLGTLYGANVDMSKVVVVMHSRSWTELTKLKDSQNRYLLESVQSGGAPARSIDGVPIFVSNQFPINETQGTNTDASSILFYDASQIIVVRREAMRLESTKDAFFSTDELGVRGVARLAVGVPNPLSIVRLKGVR
jgi:HK97 family phage major capsid protein